jgi:hypothetical protein
VVVIHKVYIDVKTCRIHLHAVQPQADIYEKDSHVKTPLKTKLYILTSSQDSTNIRYVGRTKEKLRIKAKEQWQRKHLSQFLVLRLTTRW